MRPCKNIIMHQRIMNSSLVILAIVLTFVNPEESKESISNIFEALGYSPVCVLNALASCENSMVTNASVPANSPTQGTPNLLTLFEGTSNIIKARSCSELLAYGDSSSGVRHIYPYDCCREKKVKAYCDQDLDGGGWTLFQNRDNLPIREDFYRTWVEYQLGFGNITGEFWLGLDNIHALVSSNLMEMRVDMEDYDGVIRWAKYGVFHVGDSSTKYALNIGRYSGDAGDSMIIASGTKFTTHDQDNDSWGNNCAVSYRGAWWYLACHRSNLNGFQHLGKHSSHADGINWYDFREHSYSLKKVSMKVRNAFNNQIL